MNKQDLLKVQTCVLKVNIHCDGCKQKVKKILQKVEGVYSVKIDSEQGKVTVSGNADPAMLLKKLTKSGKHAELWGGNGHKGFPNNSQSQFMNMMQMGGKDGGKLHKGGGGDFGGGKDLMKGGSLPPQFKGFKDLKAPSKDQKSVKFNLRDEHGEGDEDDYSDDEDYSDEDYTDEEDYTDDEGDGSEEEIDHKHPQSKMMPLMNGKGQVQVPGHSQAVNGMNMMTMNKMKGKGGGGGGGGNGADMKALMMMLNEKKGEADVHGGKWKKDKNNDSDDDFEDDSDFDMPIIKMGGNDGKKGDGKHKEGKVKHGGGGGFMKSVGGLFGGGQKKSKGGKDVGEFKKKSKGDHDHKHQGENGGKTKGGSGGGGGNKGKMGKDHGFINNGHDKADGGKINGSHGGFQNINVNQGGKGGGGGGPKMGGHIEPISHMNMGHQGPRMGNFQAVQGLPAQGGMNPGYYNPGMGQGNPYNQQQQQHMAMMMNQQQQQQAGMHGGGELYHPMMYARPNPAVNYANGYVPPMPPPSHPNPYSHMFSDENTEGCSIM